MERILNFLGRALAVAGADGSREIARRHQKDYDIGVPAIGRHCQIEMMNPGTNVVDDRRNVGSSRGRVVIVDKHPNGLIELADALVVVAELQLGAERSLEKPVLDLFVAEARALGRAPMALFSACAGKSSPIAIVAVTAAIAIKHAELRRLRCIEQALRALHAPF